MLISYGSNHCNAAMMSVISASTQMKETVVTPSLFKLFQMNTGLSPPLILTLWASK